MTPTPNRPVLASILTACVLALTACGSASTSAVPVSTPTPSTATTTTTTTTATSSASMPMPMPMPTAPPGPHRQADITFAQGMTVHHQAAIAMADLAATRASSPAVKTLALQIKAAQTPEIREMAGWLAAWAPSTDMNGMPNSTASAASGSMGAMAAGSMGAGSMPGMMSNAEMSALTASSGAAFDKMFLQLMIVHHEGALTMSKTEKAGGSNPSALALADSIIAGQSAQIAQMQGLLKRM